MEKAGEADGGVDFCQTRLTRGGYSDPIDKWVRTLKSTSEVLQYGTGEVI
jgi:hypothetical protein